MQNMMFCPFCLREAVVGAIASQQGVDDKGNYYSIELNCGEHGTMSLDVTEATYNEATKHHPIPSGWDKVEAFGQELEATVSPCTNVMHNEINCEAAGLPPTEWCEDCTKAR